MIKAIIFDWAGTMVDFGSRAPMGAFVKLFESEGINLSIYQARIPMGTNKWDHINALLHIPEIQSQWVSIHGRTHNSTDVDRLLNIYIPMNKISIEECSSLVPGAAELVKVLRARNIKIGSTTGYTRELMNVLMPLAANQGYTVDVSACAGDTPLGRPSSQMMEMCSKELGLENSLQFIKVDDTLPGIDEGKNFGCWTVGVALSGNALGLSLEELHALSDSDAEKMRNNAREAIRKMNPDFVIDSVDDLLPIIDKINLRLAMKQFPNSYPIR